MSSDRPKPPPQTSPAFKERLLAPLDRLQSRHRPVAVLVGVVFRYSEDGGGNLAALIAYWGFFSLFPLLLALVTILAFVLHGNPAAQRAVVHSALSNYPVIGPELAHNLHSLSGSPIGLVVGLAGTLFAGLGVLSAVQHAFETIWGIPRTERASYIAVRVRGLFQLAVFGLLLLVSTAVAGIASSPAKGGPLAGLIAALIALVINIGLFYSLFRIYTPSRAQPQRLWPGVLFGAVGWQLLQHIGGLYVTHVIDHAKATAGVFALVIGLLVWLYIGGRLLVLAIELNVVLARGLYPRPLSGSGAGPRPSSAGSRPPVGKGGRL
jgi:YihY family inner membrane protein